MSTVQVYFLKKAYLQEVLLPFILILFMCHACIYSPLLFLYFQQNPFKLKFWGHFNIFQFFHFGLTKASLSFSSFSRGYESKDLVCISFWRTVSVCHSWYTQHFQFVPKLWIWRCCQKLLLDQHIPIQIPNNPATFPLFKKNNFLLVITKS